MKKIAIFLLIIIGIVSTISYLYLNSINNQRIAQKENIKFELIRHTIFSIIIFIIICIASIIEAYLSTNLLLLIITKL